MARATNYEGRVRQQLEMLVDDSLEGYVYAGAVADVLDDVSRRLRNHDGWADWREIHASVYSAALVVCDRPRRLKWQSAREAIELWGSAHNADVAFARVSYPL